MPRPLRDPLHDLPRLCPLCHHGRTDAEAVHVHNLRCAVIGERTYPSPSHVPIA